MATLNKMILWQYARGHQSKEYIWKKPTHHGGFSYAATQHAVAGNFYEFEGEWYYVVGSFSEFKTLIQLWDENGLPPNATKAVTGVNETKNIPANRLVISEIGSPNFRELFYNSQFNQNIENWDVSKVKSLYRTFGNSPFNQPIENWDVSQVETAHECFFSTPFNQPLNNWDVANIETMSSMFYSSGFNKPLHDWDVSNVKTMNNMFRNSPFNQPIGNWNVGSCENFGGMFYDMDFNQNIGNWDVRSATVMNALFRNNTSFVQDISGWCVETNPSHNNFDTNTNPSWTSVMKPQWGQPC